MDKELLMERITALCKEKGVNLTTAFEQSGVGKNFRSNLKPQIQATKICICWQSTSMSASNIC